MATTYNFGLELLPKAWSKKKRHEAEDKQKQ